MNTLVVYYSLEGNTKFVADIIAEKMGAQLLPLVPKKAYPTGRVSKYFWGGRSAVMGDCPELEPYDISIDDFDTIIIGTPVWASTFAPPIKTFLSANIFSGKRVAFFANSAGGSAEKCFERLSEAVGENNIVSRLWLVDPLKRNTDKARQEVEEFCRKLMLLYS